MIFVNSKHPYHQHINHFQIYQTSAPSHILRVGEWRDVYLGNLDEDWGNPELILMHTYDYVGDYVVHCHIVEHEDSGLMSAYNVQECASDAGTIWNWSNANNRVSVNTRPDIFTIDVSSSITKAFEFAGNDYSAIPSNILATANQFFGRVINVRDPSYPELCGEGFGYPYCFNIQVFSQITRSATNSNIGNVTITLEGGMNPSRTQAASVTTADGRSVSVPPLALKFDTLLTWEGERSAPVSSLGLVFEIGWTYGGSATNDYDFSLVQSEIGTVVGYRIRYGSSEQSFVFPGEILADDEPLNGNIVEDSSARQMNSTGGFTRLYLLFDFISESSIYVDPIISSNLIDQSSASSDSSDSSHSSHSSASSDNSSASEPSNFSSHSPAEDSSNASLASISFCLLLLLAFVGI